MSDMSVSESTCLSELYLNFLVSYANKSLLEIFNEIILRHISAVMQTLPHAFVVQESEQLSAA